MLPAARRARPGRGRAHAGTVRRLPGCARPPWLGDPTSPSSRSRRPGDARPRAARLRRRRASGTSSSCSTRSRREHRRARARPLPRCAADTIRRMDPSGDTDAPSSLRARPIRPPRSGGARGRRRSRRARPGDRQATGRNRALLTTDKLSAGERLVVMPLDEEVDVRVDGDALAVWLGSGSLERRSAPAAAVAPEPTCRRGRP